MWTNYNICTTKEKIIEEANRVSFYGFKGGYVNTNGAWSATRNPEEFAEMLTHFFGFEIVECYETDYSTAIAITDCGLLIAWNGHVRTVQ